MTSIARGITKFTEREIQHLFATARPVLRTPAIEIRTAPATLAYGRVLIVIPRRVGTAPERNKIKRWIKALFYQEKWYAAGLDAIMLIRPAAKELDYYKLKALLSNIYIRIRAS